MSPEHVQGSLARLPSPPWPPAAPAPFPVPLRIAYRPPDAKLLNPSRDILMAFFLDCYIVFIFLPPFYLLLIFFVLIVFWSWNTWWQYNTLQCQGEFITFLHDACKSVSYLNTWFIYYLIYFSCLFYFDLLSWKAQWPCGPFLNL